MRLLFRLVFSIFALLAATQASARCVSLTAFVTPTTSFTSSTSSAGTIGLATLNIRGIDCAVGSFGGFYLLVPFGSAATQMPRPTNVWIATTGAPVTTVSNGSTGNNCTGQVAYNSVSSGTWSSNTQTAIAFSGTAGFKCNVDVQLPFRLTKQTGAIGGAAQATLNPLSMNPSIGGFAVSTSWVSNVNYGYPTQDGTPSQSADLAAGLTFAQALCTLAVTTNGPANTVMLPAASVSHLAQDGATTGTTPFSLTLNNCSNSGSVPVNVNVTWGFTSKSGLPTVIDTGIAKLGVQVQCGTAFISNAAPSTLATLSARLNNGLFSQTCSALYVAVGGAASPGSFSVPVTLTLGYQ